MIEPYKSIKNIRLSLIGTFKSGAIASLLNSPYAKRYLTKEENMKRNILSFNGKITFNNDEKSKLSTNLPVSESLAKMIENIPRTTSYSLNINSTTGGVLIPKLVFIITEWQWILTKSMGNE